MVKALVVETHGQARVVETPGELDDLRRLLGGGWLEGVGAADADWHAYVDEEGKIKGLPLNPRATAVARQLGWPSGDVLCGPVVFLGTGREGEEADCPSHILELF